MDFYIFLSFIMGNLVTLLCIFIERAYSDLISLKLPKIKKKHEINDKVLEIFKTNGPILLSESVMNQLAEEAIKKYTSHPSLKENLEELLKGIKFQERVLKEIFKEYDMSYEADRILGTFDAYKFCVEKEIEILGSKRK
ncbi:oxidoreductase [Leptospira interrogans]|uniref:oxidoreductase n=1 Tax=Leptospira interrogans TaxID=173 RepID=UPI0010BFFE15|nr:oxidoreductase [Leptospira interrogans]QCO41015.1 oxidoreductase [Leptospira interrogans]